MLDKIKYSDAKSLYNRIKHHYLVNAMYSYQAEIYFFENKVQTNVHYGWEKSVPKGAIKIVSSAALRGIINRYQADKDVKKAINTIRRYINKFVNAKNGGLEFIAF